MKFLPRLSEKTLVLSTLWLLGSGLLCLLVAGSFWLHEHHVLASERTATGTITDFIGRTDAAGHVLFYPHVVFRTPDSQIREFIGPEGTNPAPFTAGERVRVVYPAGEPSRARIGTTGKVYPVAAPVGLAGIVLFDVGGFFWLAHYLRRRRAGKPRAPKNRRGFGR